MGNFSIFKEWYDENYTNPNQLANALGVNSGRIYRTMELKHVPSTLIPELNKLGCKVVLVNKIDKSRDGQKLRKYLIENRITNRAFAKALDVQPQYITNLFQKNKFSAKLLTKIKHKGYNIF